MAERKDAPEKLPSGALEDSPHVPNAFPSRVHQCSIVHTRTKSDFMLIQSLDLFSPLFRFGPKWKGGANYYFIRKRWDNGWRARGLFNSVVICRWQRNIKSAAKWMLTATVECCGRIWSQIVFSRIQLYFFVLVFVEN